MDERGKTIKELEKKRRKELDSLIRSRKALGRALLVRFDETGEPSRLAGEELGEYRRLRGEIAGSENLIVSIKADTLRLKEAEEEAARLEKEYAGGIKERSALQARLGEYLMQDEATAGITDSYRRQLEVLVPKIRSLEDRLEGIAERDASNVLSWVGRGAQSLVVRSLLAKNQTGLRRIYAAAGEQFAHYDFQDPSGGIAELQKALEEREHAVSGLGEELTILKRECRKITDSFGGHPAKRVQALEKQIAQLGEEIDSLCLRVSIAAEREEFASLLRAEERAALERIGAARESLRQYGARIETLRASLAIDAERAKIARMERAIAEHERRIADGRRSIRDLKKDIAAANQRIAELENI
jgi:chromosome segregation ATPase